LTISILWEAAYCRMTSNWFSGEYCWCSVDMRTYWAARELESVVGGMSVVFIAVTNLGVELRVTTAHKQRALS
jgi:hypothetical protein